MAKKQFGITLHGYAVIELDDAVLNTVDDEWRDSFYNLTSPEDIAAHIAFNLIVNHWKLSQLDGWADMPDKFAQVGDSEWDIVGDKLPLKKAQE